MKKIISVFISIAVLCSFQARLIAQEKTQTRIATVTEKDNNIAFTISSDKKFIFGGNRYVLHIGDKVYMRSQQSFENGKGLLTFFISKSEFDKLPEGKSVYLSYGNMESDEQELEKLSTRDYPTCWSLGKFTKRLLSK